MKKTYLYLGLAGLGLSTLTGFSQGRPDDRPHPGPRVPFEIPEELQELKASVDEARDALKASRDEIIAALGEGATREEIHAALEEWKLANEDAIEATRALADELRESMKELRPERPDRPDVVAPPEEIMAARDETKEIRDALRVSREAVLADLPEDATIEEKRAALDAWREANVESLERLDELNKIIREFNMANRPDKGERPHRGSEVRERVHEFRASVRAAREELRAALEAAETDEERQALVEAFREKQRELIAERKELHRLERR